jgi:hypothetical protein
MATIAFRNQDQAILFDAELSGQISDGHWENSGPRDHWKPWCRAGVIVDPANLGRDFWAQKDNYNFKNRDLLEVVGKRMINHVRAGRVFGAEGAKTIAYLFDLDDNFRGLPTYEGDYWDKVRARVLELLGDRKPEEVAALIEAVQYDEKDLKRDLADMMKIVRMRRS